MLGFSPLSSAPVAGLVKTGTINYITIVNNNLSALSVTLNRLRKDTLIITNTGNVGFNTSRFRRDVLAITNASSASFNTRRLRQDSLTIGGYAYAVILNNRIRGNALIINNGSALSITTTRLRYNYIQFLISNDSSIGLNSVRSRLLNINSSNASIAEVNTSRLRNNDYLITGITDIINDGITRSRDGSLNINCASAITAKISRLLSDTLGINNTSDIQIVLLDSPVSKINNIKYICLVDNMVVLQGIVQ